MSPWWAVATYVVALFTASGLIRLLDPTASTASPSWLWLAPALAAGITWLVGRRALAIMLPAPVSTRQVRAHTILGVGAAVVLLALVGIGLVLLGRDALAGAALGASVLPTVLLLVPLAFALELGWRGTLQPLLEPRIGRLWACLAVGVAWAAWRLEVDDAAGIVATLVTSVALSVLLGYLGTGSWWQRWITAGVVQALVSVGLVLVAGSARFEGAGSLVVAGASVVVAVVWLLMFRAAQRRRAARAASA
ncbi:CPBP family glutamic-type intramembrane protease [Agrococcus sp. SGAir0287]|uniref:CPBP family glutamic-type intramembrane protease n=1 Tax=Agrococcus sp. SGAir0287 TaxID=2070347 RepID=UPI00158689FC|nr:CPBP family glutamic-type intramembrane protease [Agrococcus sp. SGAir0287]